MKIQLFFLDDTIIAHTLKQNSKIEFKKISETVLIYKNELVSMTCKQYNLI